MLLIPKDTEIGYGHISVARVTTDLDTPVCSDILLHGDNGAGKSTLLRTLSFNTAPTKGKIPGVPRKRIFINEDFNFPSDMPVIQGIKLLCAKNRFEEAMAAAEDLTLEYKKAWSAISKGNQQRVRLLVGTFHALQMESIHLYDEPLSGLDAASTNYFLKLWETTQRQHGFEAIRVFSMHGDHRTSRSWDYEWKVTPRAPGKIAYVQQSKI